MYTPKGYQEFESPSLRKPEKENQRQVHLNADFLFAVCTAPPQAAGDVGAPANEISERRRCAEPPTGDVGTPADEIPERRRCAGPPAGDVEATADEITERRRCAGPPTGDVGATANEISERRRCAEPPTGDVEATATKSRRGGGAQDRLREMSGRQRRNPGEKEVRGAAYGLGRSSLTTTC